MMKRVMKAKKLKGIERMFGVGFIAEDKAMGGQRRT